MHPHILLHNLQRTLRMAPQYGALTCQNIRGHALSVQNRKQLNTSGPLVLFPSAFSLSRAGLAIKAKGGGCQKEQLKRTSYLWEYGESTGYFVCLWILNAILIILRKLWELIPNSRSPPSQPNPVARMAPCKQTLVHNLGPRFGQYKVQTSLTVLRYHTHINRYIHSQKPGARTTVRSTYCTYCTYCTDPQKLPCPSLSVYYYSSSAVVSTFWRTKTFPLQRPSCPALIPTTTLVRRRTW